MTSGENSGGRTRDENLWREATWSAPFTVQAVIAVTAAVAWLLGALFVQVDDDATRQMVLIVATVIAAVLSVAVGGVLLAQPMVKARGIGISLLASAGVVLIGGISFGLTFF